MEDTNRIHYGTRAMERAGAAYAEDHLELMVARRVAELAQRPFSLFERALFMVTCLAVMLYVVVTLFIYYRVYVALSALAEAVQSVPGLGG